MADNVVRGSFKDPKTKADLMDRMMRRDFDGDFANLAVDRKLRMEKIRPHRTRLYFDHSGNSFDVTIHKVRPPSEATAKTPKRKSAAKKAAKGTRRTRAQTGAEAQTGTE